MTRQEIIELSKKIEEYFDILQERFVYTKLVSDTLAILLKHGATPNNIDIFCSIMGEFVDEVKKIIEELDNSF